MNNIKKLYEHYRKSSGVTTDSRQVKKNMLFFALRGENFDGNRFADDALKSGCRLAIVDDPNAAEKKDCFLVKDVLHSLQELAKYHRDQLKIPIIAITGSNGKTTTKELIYQVLNTKFKTLATTGNLNNHIGVPLTILEIKDEEIAIIEMGANHPGEIDFLSRIAKPDYGIITNIGKAHLEGFGSFEGVKRTKSELYRYLNEKNGKIFINGTNEILTSLANLPNLEKVYYMDGESPLCDGYIMESREKLKVGIKFIELQKTYTVNINLSGAYNLENIIAAACIGTYFEVDVNKILSGLENYKSSNNRSQFIETSKNKLLLDAYNANPTSMRESLKNFASFSGKKIAILGDMLEMGKYSRKEHEDMLKEIEDYSFDKVFLVGEEFYNFREKFDFSFFENLANLHEHFVTYPVNDYLILLKGSRGIALERLKDVL